ncbi:MAG TPA: helix-turn-helix domain-containing protein, partial [Herpetosiphonaceae bacterium]|nr:helix-turn-helix domain-containing protein [Herpetosiphonaceae bacterium]
MERSFGQWIKQRRKALTLTQEELAEEIGYAISTVRKIESGVLRPSREIAVTLARTLQIAEDEQDEFVRLARAPQDSAAKAAAAAATQAAPAATQAVPAAPGLPAPPTALIGRAEEMAAVCGLLEGGARLLNLIGPPGIGKTRLALEVALHMRPAFAGRVFWVALNALNDAPYVPQALAQALGVQLRPGQDPAESIRAALADAPALLVFDNFEHVLPAVPLLADLLAHCPRLSILVTSRVVLHLRGEHQYPVPPLPLPDLTIAPSWQVIEQFPAVHLFVACARAVLPTFSLTADNAGSIGLICARLDGLPLAIELIAARVRLMSPAMLAARLTRRLALLNGQVQDRPMRQQTLSAAIAWSYDNLAPAEQRLFRWLSVFSGGADLPAIEAVCQAALDPDDVIDVIAALLDKSMVRCTVLSEGDNRFGMLETISEYAREQLLALDESAAAEAAHARHSC